MSEPATETQTDTPSTDRLVIRIKLAPREPPPPPPAPRLSKGAQLAIVGAVVVLVGWFGIGSLKSDPPPPPAAAVARAQPPPKSAKPVEPEVPPQPEAPLSATHEVIPDVPQSALDTIRGTIRVIVRVSIDKQGMVVAAIPDEPGPSRYFRRLSVEAAKKWTFTASKSDDQRAMRVQFNYRRDGATASASPAPK